MLRVPPDIGIATDGTYGQDIKVFMEISTEKFDQDIIDSELLSRGWVYQEVLLTPANLFCTTDMLWWSCSTNSCCQMFPKGIPDYRKEDKTMVPFVDSIRERKLGMMAQDESEDPIRCWMGVVQYYSATSVTVSDDRFVAIAGLAKVFASRFHYLQHAVCHSGVWSTDVVGQLLWKIREKDCPKQRLVSRHAIPSWSPLSCQARLEPFYDFGPPNTTVAQYVSMATCGLDQFGRAKERKDCVLHLKGVLVPAYLSNNPKRLYPRGQGYGDLELDLHWDTAEEQEAAAAEYSPTSRPLCALLCAVDTCTRYRIAARGLVLRPHTEGLRPDCGDSDETACKTWARCGAFTLLKPTGSLAVSAFREAFQIRRYGLALVSEDRWQVRLERTGDPPDLEDVYIV